ncbi:DUF2797 domain-containing protein [Candidatus Parvarchaeota archaeon]|nr:DUF2797 domain-containing protein [Candidatus Parvarchaeota archaeon]
MPRHIVGFLPANSRRASPALEVVQQGSGTESFLLPLAGNLKIGFSRTVACIGHYDGKERHPCPNSSEGRAQCPQCRQKDIMNAYTFGDFSDYPEKYREAQRQHYSIYVAQFGCDLHKCGLTKTHRLKDRLIEQGADFGAEVAKFLGPDQAYESESELSVRFGIKKSIMQKQKNLRLTFNEQEARMRFDALLFKLKNSLGSLEALTGAFEPFCATGYYPKLPCFPADATFISGHVFGSRGNLVFFRQIEKENPAQNPQVQSSNVFCIDMRQQVGRMMLGLESRNRSVQSRLNP